MRLGLKEVGLWARQIVGELLLHINLVTYTPSYYQHDGKADSDCITLQPSSGLMFTSTQPLHLSVVSTTLEASKTTTICKPNRSAAANLTEEESDSDTDEEVDPLPIADILNRIHSKMPAYNFPQYLTALI
jgi:hypothetical protein